MGAFDVKYNVLYYHTLLIYKLYIFFVNVHTFKAKLWEISSDTQYIPIILHPKAPFHNIIIIVDTVLRPFIFNYLVYGSADPIFHDFEEKKFHFFFLQIFSCRSQARFKGGGLASAAVQL